MNNGYTCILSLVVVVRAGSDAGCALGTEAGFRISSCTLGMILRVVVDMAHALRAYVTRLILLWTRSRYGAPAGGGSAWQVAGSMRGSGGESLRGL